MDDLIKLIEALPDDIDNIKEALGAVVAAIVVLIGTVYPVLTAVAAVWDKLFGSDKGGNLLKRVGAFLRRWSLLKDEKTVPTEPLIKTADPEPGAAKAYEVK